MAKIRYLPRFWSTFAGIVWGGSLLAVLYRGIQGIIQAQLPWGVISQYVLPVLFGGLAIACLIWGRRNGPMGWAFLGCALLSLAINPLLVIPLLENLPGISFNTSITLPQILQGCLYLLVAADCFIPKLPKWMRWLFIILPVAILVSNFAVDVLFMASRFPERWMGLGVRYYAGLLLDALLDGLAGIVLGIAFFRAK